MTYIATQHRQSHAITFEILRNRGQNLRVPHKIRLARHCEETVKNGYFSLLTRQSPEPWLIEKIASVASLPRNDGPFPGISSHRAITTCF